MASGSQHAEVMVGWQPIVRLPCSLLPYLTLGPVMRSSAEDFEEKGAKLARGHIPEFCGPEICLGGDDAYWRMGTPWSLAGLEPFGEHSMNKVNG